jgi:hypothetical protein
MPHATAQDVVYRGIALLRAAMDKKVELRDPKSRAVLEVDVWGGA